MRGSSVAARDRHRVIEDQATSAPDPDDKLFSFWNACHLLGRKEERLEGEEEMTKETATIYPFKLRVPELTLNRKITFVTAI